VSLDAIRPRLNSDAALLITALLLTTNYTFGTAFSGSDQSVVWLGSNFKVDGLLARKCDNYRIFSMSIIATYCLFNFKGHNVPRPGCVNASANPLNTKTYDRDSSTWLKENSETSLL